MHALIYSRARKLQSSSHPNPTSILHTGLKMADFTPINQYGPRTCQCCNVKFDMSVARMAQVVYAVLAVQSIMLIARLLSWCQTVQASASFYLFLLFGIQCSPTSQILWVEWEHQGMHLWKLHLQHSGVVSSINGVHTIIICISTHYHHCCRTIFPESALQLQHDCCQWQWENASTGCSSLPWVLYFKWPH